MLCDRVPPDLKEQLTRLHADIESVERTVAESDKHVWTAINSLSADFKSDRAQWRVILMTIAVSFIGLFSAWVFKGGMFK